MHSETEYQAVPTSTRARVVREPKKGGECCEMIEICATCIVFKFIVVGSFLVFFSSIQFLVVNSLSKEPGVCRVKNINIQLESKKSFARRKPVWIVDFVEKVESRNGTEEFSLISSDLQIAGNAAYTPLAAAFDVGSRMYTVSTLSLEYA